MKALAEPELRLVERFCDALWLADGLARNTLDSYRRDVTQFAAWLATQTGDRDAAEVYVRLRALAAERHPA